MKTSLLPRLLLLIGPLALSACRQDPLGDTGVQLDLLTSDRRLFATHFEVWWMDERSHLLQVRVPEEGAIDAVQAPAVSVFISGAPDRAGLRRVLVRGYQNETIVSEAATRLLTSPRVWVELPLTMRPAGSLPDSDRDGLPDVVDNCPRNPAETCMEVAAPPDAAAPDDAFPDPDGGDAVGVAGDPAPDAGRALEPEVAYDVGRDVGRDLGRDVGRDLGPEVGYDAGQAPGSEAGRDPDLWRPSPNPDAGAERPEVDARGD